MHMIKAVQLHEKEQGIKTNMKVKHLTIKGINKKTYHNIIFGLVVGGRYNADAIGVD